MKSITKVFCVLITIITITTSFSHIVGSNVLDKKNKILVETRFYDNNSLKKKYCEFDEDELEYLKECLINLNDAYINDNKENIQKFGSILYEKGLLDEKPNMHSFDEKIIKNSPLIKFLCNHQRDENISNSFCYINAVGEGLMIFTIGALLTLPTLVLISIFGGEILSLLIPIYVVILVLTHLIPVRVLLPIGIITMDSGNITTVGLSGNQNMEVNSPSVQLQLAGFTGITINIPTGESGGFLFVSGISILAKGYKS